MDNLNAVPKTGGSNYSPDLFVPASDAEKASVSVMRPVSSYWKDAWKSLRKNKVALASMILIVVVVLSSIIIPLLSPYGFEEISNNSNASPSFEHPFGTDTLGRDLLVRNMVGTRISILIGLISAIVVVFIGVVYGAIAGYFGGWVDTVMMRIVDIIYSVPTVLLAILLQVALKDPLTKLLDSGNMPVLSGVGPGLISIILVLIAVYWVDMARIVRGQVLSLKQQEYVLASKTLGSSGFRIIMKHLIPNCMGSIIITATLKIPQGIFFEAFLSFIGLGVSAPMASLGSLVSDGIKSIYALPYQALFPSLVIAVIILAFNLFGDGLRDALDPRMKR